MAERRPELEGEHVLVTGGSNGIGAAIVEVALEHGGVVSFVDIDAEAGGRHAARLGARCSFAHADVTSRESIDGVRLP